MGFWDFLSGKPSRDKFAKIMVNALQKNGVEGPFDYDAHMFALRFQGQLLNLANAYTDYCNVPRRDRARVLAAYVPVATDDPMVTTIALYDGRQVRHYVHGDNLTQFKRDIAEYKLIVTYNGKCFDVPYIESSLGCKLPQAHIDLRFVLASIGFKGGLKACERTLGFSRPGLQDVDGYFAVLLWQEYQRTGNDAALETLLAYNIEDVLMLERLATVAYNRKIAVTPFADSHRLADALPLANPFTPDARMLDRIRERFYSM